MFLTLTFSDNITNISYAFREFSKYIQRLNYALGFNLKYVAVPQFQERGAVHFHVILFNFPFISGFNVYDFFRDTWGLGKDRKSTRLNSSH